MNPQQQQTQPEERIEAALAEIRRASTQMSAAPRKLLDGLNQSLRRLRTFDSEAQWSAIIVDACAPFASRVAVFSVNVNTLRLQAARGSAGGVPEKEIAIAEARAFKEAIETAEPVVAIRTAAEMSSHVARMFGENADERFTVFPIHVITKVVGTIYAESDDTSAIDLIATLAGAVLESHRAEAAAVPEAKSGMIRIELNAPVTADEKPLGGDHELAHLRARRFARVSVAGILLGHGQALDTGRKKNDVYGELKQQIDQVRAEYQRRFLNDAPIHADYLHNELVKTFGRNDEALLGPDYPGSMA